MHYKDPNGNLHFLEDSAMEYLLPAGTVPITDVEAQSIRTAQNPPADPQIAINAEARAYLASTDWYVIRNQETGETIPPEVLDLRQQARERVK
jgi:hypothetical protein